MIDPSIPENNRTEAENRSAELAGLQEQLSQLESQLEAHDTSTPEYAKISGEITETKETIARHEAEIERLHTEANEVESANESMVVDGKNEPNMTAGSETNSLTVASSMKKKAILISGAILIVLLLLIFVIL